MTELEPNIFILVKYQVKNGENVGPKGPKNFQNMNLVQKVLHIKFQKNPYTNTKVMKNNRGNPKKNVKFCMRDFYDKSNMKKYFGSHGAKILSIFGGLSYYN